MIVLVVSFVILLFLGIPIAYVLGISSLFYFLATDNISLQILQENYLME